mgnify:CR=1 FL=1
MSEGLASSGEPIGDMVVDQIMLDPDPEHHSRAEGLDVCLPICPGAAQHAGMGFEPKRRGCRLGSSAATFKQTLTQRLFQRFDPAGNGGLGDAEAISSAAEAARCWLATPA